MVIPPIDHVYWVSCLKFTVCVRTHNGVIVEAAPIVRKFVGQPTVNLLNWARKFGGLKVVEIMKVVA